MNKTYSKVWSAKHGAYVVASEIATAMGKGGGSMVATLPDSAVKRNCATKYFTNTSLSIFLSFAFTSAFATSTPLVPLSDGTLLDFSQGTLSQSGWVTNGNIELLTDPFTSNHGGNPFTLIPAVGEGMVRIRPSGSSLTIANIDSFLGLASGTMLGIVSSSAVSGPHGNTTNYGAMTANFSLAANTSYSFAWAYSAGDYLPFTDGVFFSLAGDGVSFVDLLARNGDANLQPGAPGYPEGTVILQSYGNTPWIPYSFTVNTTGLYTIGFGSFNALDQGLDPELFVSAKAGTFIGTPVQTTGGSSGPSVINANSSASSLGETAIFDGGTISLDSDLSTNLDVTDEGGVFDTQTQGWSSTGNIVDASGQTGSITITGGGSLALSGANAYTGGTTVTGQTTLIIQNQTALGSGGLILNEATLSAGSSIEIDQEVTLLTQNNVIDTSSNLLTISGNIIGTGGVTIEGDSTGKLILSGDTNVGGIVTVNTGATLCLTGNMSADAVQLNADGTLEGRGRIITSIVSSDGGVITPGCSVGTLTVQGDVTLSTGSLFAIEIDGREYSPSGGRDTYDRLIVEGDDAAFTAAGTIRPILRGITGDASNDFTPVIGDRFTVITAANILGGFDSLEQPSEGLQVNTRFDVIYNEDSIDLVISPTSLADFISGLGLRNGLNVSRALDLIRPSSGLRGNTDRFAFFNGLYGLGAVPLATTLLQASGEIHAFALSETRQSWQASNGQVAKAASINAHRNVWVDTSAQDIKYDQDAYASAYTSNNTHLWVGTHVAEYKDTQFGVAAGVDRRKMSSANTGSAETDTNALALYAIGRKDQFDYSAVFSLNQSKIDTKRQTGLSTGALSNTSDSKAKGAVLSISAGFNHALNDKVNGRVWVNGLVDQTKADALTEQGSTVTALAVAKESFKSAQATVGYSLSGNVLVPDSRPGKWSLGVGVSKLMSEGRPHVSRQMSLHGASWQVTTPKVGTTTEFVQAGVILPVGTNADAWINLGASKRDGASASSGSVGLSVKW